MATPATILILEPNAARLGLYRAAFATYSLLFAQTPVDLLTLLARQRPDLVLIGARIAGGPTTPASLSGRLGAVDICRIIKRSPAADTLVLLCAEDAGPLAALRARRAGADRLLPNPVAAETLREAVDDLLPRGSIAAWLRRHGVAATHTPHLEPITASL